jgi:hypothetical protein
MAAEEIPVSAYASKLLNRADVAEGTMAFHFERLPGFDFKSGLTTVGIQKVMADYRSTLSLGKKLLTGITT